MPASELKFIDLCLINAAACEDIDYAIALWHDSKTNGESLADYLGLTEAEYAAWVENSKSLYEIIESRRSKKNEK